MISFLTFTLLVFVFLAVKACSYNELKGVKANKIGSMIAYNFAMTSRILLFVKCGLDGKKAHHSPNKRATSRQNELKNVYIKTAILIF
jgi:hypothetical protein